MHKPDCLQKFVLYSYYKEVYLIVAHLKENGIIGEQIVEMNFESYAFKNMNSDTCYEYVKGQVIPNKRLYLMPICVLVECLVLPIT